MQPLLKYLIDSRVEHSAGINTTMMHKKLVTNPLKFSTICWKKHPKPMSYRIHRQTMIRITINCFIFIHQALQGCQKRPLSHILDTFSLQPEFITWPISNRMIFSTHHCRCIILLVVLWASDRHCCLVRPLLFGKNSPHLAISPIVKSTSALLHNILVKCAVISSQHLQMPLTPIIMYALFSVMDFDHKSGHNLSNASKFHKLLNSMEPLKAMPILVSSKLF